MKRILLTLFLLTFLSSAVNAQWDKRGGAILGQEEGTDLDFFTTIDAVGAGIVASLSGNVLTLTVAGGGAATFTVKENNVVVAADINVLDFLGADFVISAAGGEAEISIEDAGIDHDATTNFVANEHIDHTAVTLTAGVGLSGGGTLAANRTFTVDLNELTTETGIAAGDLIAMVDITDSGSGKITFANFEGDLNHDALLGFVLGEHIAEGTIDHGSIAGLADDDHSAYENELNNSSGLLAALSDETGTVLAVFSNSPTLVTPALGTPSALVGTNISGTGASFTAGVSTLATVTDNESTAEENPIVFVAGADPDGGTLGLETDGTATYNPSTGTITTTEFVGGGVGITGVTASHAGTITWTGTSILESGVAFGFGDASDATLTHTYANTGTDVVIAYSTAAMDVTGALTATNLSGTNTGDQDQDSKSISIESPTSSEDITLFFTNVAITITEMRAVLNNGTTTPSVTWTIRHHASDRANVGTEVVTGGTTTTSVTTGSDVTSFNDATIPADSFVWFVTTAKSGTVPMFSVTVIYDED